MSRNTAIAKTNSKESFLQIRNYLFEKKKAIANLATAHFDSERMIRIALGAVSRQPQLLECTPNSWLLALMDCAFYGLEPNPRLGHIYLVPFRNRKLPGNPLEVTTIVGYKGLILLACETAGFHGVDARIVYENELRHDDQFKGPRFEERPEDPMKPFFHRPLYNDPGPMIGAYAVGWKGPDKRPKFLFDTKTKLDQSRSRSKARDSGPWKTDAEAMYKKTAIRRLLATAELRPSGALDRALLQDSALDRGHIVRSQDESKVEDAEVVMMDEPPVDESQESGEPGQTIFDV